MNNYKQEDIEIIDFLYKHMKSIIENDVATYHETTSKDLTLYEWFVTPHRIDGIPFHDFMMETNATKGTVFGSDIKADHENKHIQSRFDLSNLRVQQYGDTSIASYTLLISTNLPSGVHVVAHNESRVIVRIDGKWQVVHCHKSPAWQAPHDKNK